MSPTLSHGESVIVCFSVVLAIFSKVCSAKPECENLYDRYCRLIMPDKCYFTYNQRLCCRTCALYKNQLSRDTEEIRCPYGDRNRTSCNTLASNECYNVYNRYACCGTCAKSRTSMSDCRYGDRELDVCQNVEAYMCYDSTIRNRCCGTCAAFDTGRQDCRYGDEMYLFERDKRRYNCAAYVGYFGYWRCRDKRDRFFRETCCQSCASVDNMRRWYRRSWFY